MTLASVIVKIALFKIGIEIQKGITYVAFFNLLVISVGVFFGIRQFKILHPQPTGFKDEVKAGMRTCALYAIMMVVFIYVYYNNIDINAFPYLVQSRMDMAQSAIDQGHEVDLVNVRQFAEFIFSPKTHATITLFGFLVAGVIYSLLISFFMRKFPGYK